MVQGIPILTGAEKFDIISKSSVEGVIIINDTGSIEEWNDYMVEKTRYSKAEICGRKIWDVQYGMMTEEWQKTYPQESLQKIWMNFIHDLKENEIIIKEGQFLAWNKDLILTEDIICLIKSQARNYLHVIQRERCRRRKIEYDVLSSIMSIELKSMISSMLDFSGFFAKESRRLNIDKLMNFAREVLASSKHRIKLIENYSVFLSFQNGNLGFNPVKVKLNPLIEDVIGLYRSQANNKNIGLNFHSSSEITCTADINLLKHIISNLVDNALKFTHEHGSVDVYTAVKHDFVEIKIKDDGVGIDHDTMGKLFLSDLNASTLGTAGEEGTGLGLMLCRKLVEKHGGKIWVESETDRGSTFSFIIPGA
jgi:signal transduction histidine kinase